MREHWRATRGFSRTAIFLCACLLVPSVVLAQSTTTYHLHTQASSTPGLFQLQTAGPSTASASLMSGPLVAPGDYQVAGFDTQSGVTNVLSYIPAGLPVTFSLWMQASKSNSTIYPEARIYVNNPSGALLCSGRASAPLTTALQQFTFNCTTINNVKTATTDRLYLWVGAAQTGAGVPTLRAKLSIEGTLNGNYDSQVTVPVSVVPSINPPSPSTGGVGTPVTITGSNLSNGQQSTVTFAGVPATTSSWTNASITAAVPLGAYTYPGNLVVTVAGVPSNAVTFTDTSPTIIGLSAGSGNIGDSLSIIGGNFGLSQGSSTVSFTNTPASTTVQATPTSWLDGRVIVNVPQIPGGNVCIVITVNGTASNCMNFTVVPTVSYPSPPSGAIGDITVVFGSGFDPTPGNSTIFFNGIPTSATSWTISSANATIPPGLTVGNASVTIKVNGVSGVSSSIANYMVLPGITSMSSNSGPAGMEVVLEGTNFGTSQGTVTFGGVKATILAWVDQSISLLVPCAPVGQVSVGVNRPDGLTSWPKQFTITLQ